MTVLHWHDVFAMELRMFRAEDQRRRPRIIVDMNRVAAGMPMNFDRGTVAEGKHEHEQHGDDGDRAVGTGARDPTN